MSNSDITNQDRRRFLKIAGGGAVMLPIIGLAGCSGGNDAAPPAAKPPTSAAPAKKAMEAPAPAAAPATSPEMPKLSVDDPQAKSLAYVEDTTMIDTARQPRFQTGQACSNCALFQKKDDPDWGGCSIFPGKLVKASGWCSVYAPKPA
ncbi:MAG: high-potential iron-sulfur protein [Woeseiaceae bacterium]